MSDWTEQDATLRRDFAFPDFAAALAFVNRVGALAEELDHHPDLLLHSYNQVRVTSSSHDVGAVTDRDHRLVARIDAL